MQTLGPFGSEELYDIPFTDDSVLKLYEKADNENCQFVLKEMQTKDAKSLYWSSVKDSLELFMHKPFEFLWKADYIPAAVKAEYRHEVVTQGLIHGVTSDYQMQSSTRSSI